MPFHAVSSANAYRLASNGDAWKRVSELKGADMSIRYWGLAPLCGRKENGSTRCAEKAWRVDKPLEKWADKSLTQPKGTRARTIIVIMVVPWLRFCQPRWRQFDLSLAHSCGYRPDYYPDSRQTRALSQLSIHAMLVSRFNSAEEKYDRKGEYGSRSKRVISRRAVPRRGV